MTKLRPTDLTGHVLRHAKPLGSAWRFLSGKVAGQVRDNLAGRIVEEIRDAIYFEQLARVARLKADASGDPDLTRRLREEAIKHERKARQMRRAGG